MINLKNKNTSIFIFSTIALSFSLAGIVGYQSSSMDFSNDNVGWVGDTPIKKTEFMSYEQTLKKENPKITNKEIINKIAERKALLKYATEKLNLAVPDKEIIDYITNQDVFKTDGKFNSTKYQEYIEKTKLPVSVYEQLVKENLLLNKLLLITNYKNKSDISNKILQDSLFQTKEIKEYKIDYKDIPVKFDETLFKMYYEANKSEFKTQPEYLTETSVIEKNEDYYKKPFESYIKNPINIYEVKQIVVKDSKLKNEILKEINNKNFNSYVKYSIIPDAVKNNGYSGFLNEKEMTPEFKLAFLNKKAGDIFAVKSSLGYHIIDIEKTFYKNISLNQYKEIFKNEIDLAYKKEIEDRKITGKKVDEFNISESELLKELGKNSIINGDQIVSNFENKIEIIKVLKVSPVRLLNINNEKDAAEIKFQYIKMKQIKEAFKLSDDILKKHTIPNDMKKYITINYQSVNKKTKLNSNYLDLIFSTPLHQYNDYLNANNYILFKIEKESYSKIKTKKFQNLISQIYNNEMGQIIINKAKLDFPIKINKDYL